MQPNINSDLANFVLLNDPDTPLEITQWLGALKLLIGVPLNYLIPAISMLPPEAIRFFYLDPNWVESLVDGACSIGRITTLDYQIDTLYNRDLQAKAHAVATNHRANIFKKSRQLQATATVTNNDINIVTGFILRSAVVKDCPGLEITAYAQDKTQQLAVYRLEKIAPDILLGMFIGELFTLCIQQPAEDLHFGIDTVTNDNQGFTKNLRNVSDGSMSALKDSMNFRPGNKQVIPITKLAEQMRTDLQVPVTNFTSAEFALEMIESLKRVEFTFVNQE